MTSFKFIRYLAVFFISSALIGMLCSCTAQPQPPTKINLFEAGKGDYAFYRIPGIVVTVKGTVLAYCEARLDNRSDFSTMDVVMRRSTDGGKSWSEPYVVSGVEGPKEENPAAVAADYGKPYGPTYNNPVAIADRDGTVHLLYCLEYMRCFYARSEDDGQTFSKPMEITATFEEFRDEYDWRVLSVGPGHGIQLKNGRLLATVRLADSKGRSPLRYTVASTLYSDDRGLTWQRGNIAVRNTPETVNPNEPIIVELADGRVMMNLRNESEPKRRLVTISPDGATGWSEAKFDDALWDSGVMASIIRLRKKPESDRTRILFANPHDLKERRNLSVKLSYDEGQTWPVNRILEAGPSAYCDLAVLPDGSILCFYERGNEVSGDPLYSWLTVSGFTLDWLTAGKDSFDSR